MIQARLSSISSLEKKAWTDSFEYQVTWSSGNSSFPVTYSCCLKPEGKRSKLGCCLDVNVSQVIALPAALLMWKAVSKNLGEIVCVSALVTRPCRGGRRQVLIVPRATTQTPVISSGALPSHSWCWFFFWLQAIWGKKGAWPFLKNYGEGESRIAITCVGTRLPFCGR